MYKTKCIDCHNKYMSEVKKKPESMASRNIKRKKMIQVRKKLAVDRLGGKCSVCGYSKCLAGLTFHHLGDKKKEKDVSQIYDASMERYLNEVDKCKLLCWNCHMELHWIEDGNEFTPIAVVKG
jgi:formate-dependent nitrite reductase cytochrome c552 subunit